MWMTTHVLEGQIALMQGELASPQLSNATERIRFLEANIADYSPRVKLLEKVHVSEQAWIGILRDLSVTVPRGVWIAQMTSRRGDKEQTLTFRGSAYSQKDIGQFMLQVDSLGWGNGPNLSYTQASTNQRDKSAAVDFEVSVPLKKPIGSDLQ